MSTLFCSAKWRVRSPTGQPSGPRRGPFLNASPTQTGKCTEKGLTDLQRARSPRSVKLLKGIQSSREAFQQESAGARFAKFGLGGLSKADEKLRNAPQLPFARLFPPVLEHIMSVEPFGLGLEIIRNVLFEILKSHDDAPYSA